MPLEVIKLNAGPHTYLLLQATTLWLVVLGVMVVTTTATLPLEETSTQATSAAMAALLQATTAMVIMEALALVVGLFFLIESCSPRHARHKEK